MLKKLLILLTTCLTLTKSYKPAFYLTNKNLENKNLTKIQAIGKVNNDFARAQFSYITRSLKKGLWECIRRCRRKFFKCLLNTPPWICWWRYKRCVIKCFWRF